jgi:hypothetical protein
MLCKLDFKNQSLKKNVDPKPSPPDLKGHPEIVKKEGAKEGETDAK